MKKLMFMLAAVAMAIGAQANSVNWGATINNASSIGSGAYTAYLLDYSKWDNYVSGDKMDSAYLTEASFGSSSLTGTGASKTTGTVVSEGIDAASISYAIVIMDSSLTQYSLLKTGTSSTYGAMDPAVTIPTASTTGPKVLGTASSGNLTWNTVEGGGDVPEPTSGLLLVMGAGLLGLRRKKK